MKLTLQSIVAVLTVSLALATAANAKGAREEINQSYEVGKRPSLSLSNLNGPARIEGWDGASIEVVAVKTTGGSRDRLDDVRIKFDMSDDHLRIDVEYEDSEDFHDDGVSVEFRIRVPRATEIERVKLVNGSLDIAGIEGNIEGSSVNGDVTGAGLPGAVQLSTVNGDVSLKGAGKESIRLKSVNGSVQLVLPRKANAKLSASTVHGDIRGRIASTSSYAGNSMDAVLGSGGPRIELGTVNGDIEIREDGERGEDRDSGE
jgi:hypothetical protein